MVVFSWNFSVREAGVAGAALTLALLLAGCGGGAGSSSLAVNATVTTSRPDQTDAAPDPASPRTASLARTQPLEVTCVGDSITFGIGTSNRDKYSYPVVLGKALGQNYQVSSFGYAGSMMSIAGAAPPYSAYQRLPIYRAALASKPNILIVALGTNDASLNLDAARQALFVKDYNHLLADFRHVSPTVRFYLCIPPAAYGPSLFRAQNIQTTLAPLIRQIAAQNGATLIDLFTPTSHKPELFPDSLHPNDAGARKIAAEMKRVLLAP